MSGVIVASELWKPNPPQSQRIAGFSSLICAPTDFDAAGGAIMNSLVSPRRNGSSAFGPTQTNFPLNASRTAPSEPKSMASIPARSACTRTMPSDEHTLASPGAVKQCTPAFLALSAIASAVTSCGVTSSTNVASGRDALSASSFARKSGARSRITGK